MAHVPTPRGFAFSIATRIRVAVAVLCMILLVLIVASIIAHDDLQRIKTGQPGFDIPALAPMQRIHRSGEDLLALGAELRAADTTAIVDSLRSDIDQHVADLTDAIAELVPHDPEPANLAVLDGAVATFARAGHGLITTASERRAQQERIADRLALFEAAHLRMTNGVDALKGAPEVGLMGEIDRTLNREGDRTAVDVAVRDTVLQGFHEVRRLGEAKADANLLYAIVTRVLERPQRDGLGKAEARFDVLAGRLVRELEVRGGSGLAGLADQGEAMVSFGRGPDSLFALGRQAVVLEARAGNDRAALAAADGPLRDGLAALYRRTSLSMVEANRAATETLFRDRIVLASAIALVLVLAVWFSWIYVGRAVATPLRRLGQAAAGIEAGHFDAPLPSAPIGEIRVLTRALSALRDRSRELVRVRRRMIRGEDATSVQDRLRVQLLTSLVEDVRVPVERMNRSVHLLRSMNIAPERGAARDCLDQLDAAAADVLYRLDEAIGVTGFWNGEVDLAPARADLPDLVEDAVATLDLSDTERARCLTMRVDETLPMVSVDPDRVRHMLVQMIAGGIAAGGAVDLDLGRAEDGGVRIRAADRGAPLAVREVERRLLSLTRVGVTAGADDRRARLRAVAAGAAAVERSMAFGRGLGLLLCDAVAHAHGGRLEIDSAAGRGTWLTVFLPASRIVPGRRSRADRIDDVPADERTA